MNPYLNGITPRHFRENEKCIDFKILVSQIDVADVDQIVFLH